MWANGGITPLISLRHRLQVVSVTCWQLYSLGTASVSFEQKNGYVSEQAWTLWTMEYLLLLSRLEPQYLSRPSRALVTIPTALVMAFYLTFWHRSFTFKF
jgi:hypothetical protein